MSAIVRTFNPWRSFVGLTGGGRLWVDDVSLEKVDTAEPLTPEPLVGDEEADDHIDASLSDSLMQRDRDAVVAAILELSK